MITPLNLIKIKQYLPTADDTKVQASGYYLIYEKLKSGSYKKRIFAFIAYINNPAIQYIELLPNKDIITIPSYIRVEL
ncbi:hypothetical protein CAXC1_300033 [Candidatus Xenohaliotis californiensis]|uniref:Uncharacterized protein n=1 Tax=Candidatus Xenohaliotis californiensis TaxID=84677 RepID=A0ABM9N895_9RICK|nr:hypothetical protein CAXC1_300033 [Candidatus Xenohaliotis californiensis]